MATSTTYLERTFAAGDRRKWTWSAWVKRANLGSNNWLFHTYLATSNECSIFFTPDDQFAFSIYTGNNDNGRLTTTRKFRDTNAWYHLQCVWDTANSTAGDRMKMYVNGVEETSFATDTNPPLNYESIFNSGINHTIGQYGNNDAGMRFSGCISHMHFSDGYALAPTVFGSTDSTTGEWQINASPSFTLGTNGFTILKDGNTITDQSSNSNNWSSVGTLTKTEDCPSNVFATLNPLDKGLTSTSFNLSNGNLTMGNASNTNDYGLRGTLGASSGKYYWEIKIVNGGEVLAVTKSDTRLTINNMDGTPDAGFWGWQSNGTGASINSYNNGTFSNSNALQGYANNSIIGVALDMDNGKLYMSIDGVFKGADNNTSDPVNQTNPFYTTIPTDGTFIMPYTEHRSSGDPASHWNFGNGYFGTTAVSSAGTNASGNGIFEYDVPTGYTALSTKGLNL